MCVRESAGLALLAFCLIAGQSEVAGVTNCAGLRSDIDDGVVIELENSFTCSAGIIIGTDINIAIIGSGNGEDNVITLDADFAGSDSNDALFYNQGFLNLTGVDITPADESEISARGVYNEGELTVTDCSFEGLNIGDEALAYGGAIFSDSTSSVTIERTSFVSNVAGEKGGAIYAFGTETLTITDSDFNDNEAVYGSGGDIYAVDGVTLKVVGSIFSYSSTDIGGAAIECCGATINDCDFIGAEANSESDEHYGGALLVGRPDSGGCSNELVVSNSNFSTCSVNSNTGAGGSVAIFDTDASISNCFFERNTGTAVLFQSSSSHEIKVENSEFYENSEPAVAYAYDGVSLASAFVIQYTGEDDDTAPVASFDTIYCYANDPYECEFLYDGATIVSEGEFKCQICSFDGDRLFIGVDEAELVESDDAEDESSSSKDSNTGIVVGLSLALGVTLVVIGALAVWKVRVRNNARRLMEDMGDNDI